MMLPQHSAVPPAPLRGKLVRGPNGFAVRAKLPAPQPAPDPRMSAASPANVSLRMDMESMQGVVAAIQQLTAIGQQIVGAVERLSMAMASIQPPVVNVEPTPIQVDVAAPRVDVAAPTVHNTVTAQPGEVVVRNTVDAHVQLPPPRARTATITAADGTTSEVAIK